MRQKLAEWLNQYGNVASDAGKLKGAERRYKLASKLAPQWSVPWYNLGLLTKNTGRWEDSLRFNQRALSLNPGDEGACWNLGIAATAMHDWPEARRAWKHYGIEISNGPGEVMTPPVSACVRLNPRGAGEVVWGERLDPARLVILNVPLPESHHRFRDIVLNDGAANGTRVQDGVQVPVFDELGIWRASEYSTLRVTLRVPSDEAERQLAQICSGSRIGLEDWSSIRILCEECSRGNPGPHDCRSREPEEGTRRFGLAAENYGDAVKALHDWIAASEGAQFKDLETVFDAQVH
jgi:tetratricopeptide (TPR) repeat protein